MNIHNGLDSSVAPITGTQTRESTGEVSSANGDLWGEDGLLARFTRAANGISDIIKRVNEILDRKYITLSGQLEITGSKRGERYAELHAAQPYHHSLYLIIRGDQGRQGDDELNEDLIGKLDGVYDVTFWVDEDYDNVTTPSRIIAQEPAEQVEALPCV